MKNIAITTKHDLKDKEVLVELIKWLRKSGKKIFLDDNAQRNYGDNHEKIGKYSFKEDVDLLFVLGGDGTVLRAVRSLQNLTTPIFGINAGHLGFLSEVQPDNLEKICLHLWNGEYTQDLRMMINIAIFREGKLVYDFRALNELVVNQSGVARIVELPTYVNDEPVAIYRADGLIVATPTGSTAYSLSAGGPILYPKMEAFILTPIAPHSFNQKPIVITPEKTIRILTENTNKEPVAITLDGQVSQELEYADEILVTCHSEKVKFLRLYEERFFKTLRGKLGWGEGFNGQFE